jgi:hypothetical protein
MILFFAVLLNNSCTAIVSVNEDEKYVQRDYPYKLHLIGRYDTGNDEYFKTENEYPVSVFMFEREIFLLDYSQRKLVILDVDNGKTKTIIRLNNNIKKYSNLYSGVKQVVVTKDYYFIGFLRAVICFTKEGEFVGKSVLNTNINFFSVNNNRIFIFSSDKVFDFSVYGDQQHAKVLENSVSGHFCSFNSDVYEVNLNQLNLFNLEEISNEARSLKVSFSAFPFEKPYLGCVTSSFTIWFPYMERNELVLVNKGTNQLVKRVEFSEGNFKPTIDEIAYEEGIPNFEILSDDNEELYIVSLRKGFLEVFALYPQHIDK